MDNGRLGLIDHENWQPFFTFLLLCGVGLILSIPIAREIQDFSKLNYIFSISTLFFYIYLVFLGVLGLNLGATSAARGECGKRMFIHLIGRVFFAQFLSLPFLLFERALFPGKEGTFALILLYGTIISLLCTGTSRLIEGSKKWSSSLKFILKYSLFVVYFFAPFGILPSLSPLTSVAALLHGEKASKLLLIFGVPFILLMTVFFFMRRHFGDEQSVQTI